MLRAGLSLLVVWLVFSAPAAALDPTRELNQYILEFYQQRDGLPSNFVIASRQTRDGYLWVGTRGGLARFDGVRFKVFDDTNPKHFRESEIWALEEGADGSLWVGTFGGGLTRIKDGQFQLYGRQEGLTNEVVRVLAAAADGIVWVGSLDGGLFRFAEGHFTAYTVADGLPSDQIRALEIDAGGRVFIGTTKGLATFESGRIVRRSASHVALGARIESLAVDPQSGGIWLGTSIGLHLYRDGNVTSPDMTGGPSGPITSLAADKDVLWVATANGLSRYRNGRFEHFFSQVATTGKGRLMQMVSLQNLQGMLIDREGSLWVGTNFDGLARLRDAAFANFELGSDNTDVRAACVFEDREGAIWAGTRQGLTRVKDEERTSFTVDGPGTFNALAEDSEGRLWAGRDDGLYRPIRDRMVRTLALDDLNTSVVIADRVKGLWIGKRSAGLHYFDGSTLKEVTADGLEGRQVRALAQDSHGGLWVGFRDAGVAQIKDGKLLARYGPEQNLASAAVSALHVDSDDVVWIATRRGLSRIHRGEVATLTTAHGLPANFFYQIVEDDHGGLWMPYGRGIMRVVKQELTDVAEGRRKSVSTTTFGTESGIKSASMVVPNQPTAWKARDGRLWFATAKGLTMVNPARLKTNLLPPPVQIEQVRLDDGAPFAGSAVTLPPGDGNVEIEYTALSLIVPEQVRFKYRLQGVDREWIDAGARRVAYYTGLGPGSYEFHVKAANNDGAWNEEGARLTLRLLPHWYQRRWLHALGALAALGALFGAYRWRVSLHVQREADLMARVQAAVAQIKTLSGLLPICASCKKIRDDGGYWNQIEVYIHQHSDADFSHSICPECMQKLYPEYVDATARSPSRRNAPD
jgi:ligand-binding sensor domain-containing protein